MAIALFMKVAGATGESKNSKYSQWTDCESISWGVQQPQSQMYGAGGTAGRADFSPLSVMAKMDKVYGALFQHCASGKHLDKVEIAGAKSGGEQMEYFKITLSDVVVTGFQPSAATGAELMVNYTFAPAKVKIEYKEQTEKGTAGASTESTWDIKANTK